MRQIRGEMDIAPSKQAARCCCRTPRPQISRCSSSHRAYLARLAGLESRARCSSADADAPESATALMGELTLLVPMAGLIDPAAEIERLDKRIAKTRDGDRARRSAKLGNENFVRNAPPEVVVTQDASASPSSKRTIAEPRSAARARAQPAGSH